MYAVKDPAGMLTWTRIRFTLLARDSAAGFRGGEVKGFIDSF